MRSGAGPLGASLLLLGHSLGGMEAQLLVPQLQNKGYHVAEVVTFGSPETDLPVAGVTYDRFAAIGDPVPSASPLGLVLAAEGHPEQIWIPVSPADSTPLIIGPHTSYDHDSALANYDALGHPIVNGVGTTLQLGPVYRYAAPNGGPEAATGHSALTQFLDQAVSSSQGSFNNILSALNPDKHHPLGW